jgi:hypothetical protein
MQKHTGGVRGTVQGRGVCWGRQRRDREGRR